MKWISLAALMMMFAVLNTGCKQEEMDDLAKAQDCLDKVPQASPGNAKACMQHVLKYDSQQAQILKCSILMTSGGLVESKIVKAYNAVQDKTDNNREASFMTYLALDYPSVTDGYGTSVEADAYCQRTGVPGLQYISGIVKIGSFMAKTMAAINGSIDFNNPADVKNATTDLLNKCNSDPRDPGCPDLATIGTSAVTLSQGYCATDNADSEVCENINAAVGASNGNASVVGDALLCYLGNKKYDTASAKCVNP